MTAVRYLLAGVVIMALISYCFFPEIGGMAWHIRHGSNVDFSDVRFHVPGLYSAKADSARRILTMVSVPGRARTYLRAKNTFKVSLISVHQLSIGETGASLDEVEDPLASHDYIKDLDINLNVAGNPGTCVGYSGSQPTWSGEKDVQIWCQLSGLQVIFSGTESGSMEFFSILGSAKPLGGIE